MLCYEAPKPKLVGTFYQTIEVKIEYEFADQEDVGIRPQFQDVWIASKKPIPGLGIYHRGQHEGALLARRIDRHRGYHLYVAFFTHPRILTGLQFGSQVQQYSP